MTKDIHGDRTAYLQRVMLSSIFYARGSQTFSYGDPQNFFFLIWRATHPGLDLSKRNFFVYAQIHFLNDPLSVVLDFDWAWDQTHFLNDVSTLCPSSQILTG